MKLACPLQEDLDRLFDWSNAWLLKFRPEKYCTMKIGLSTKYTSYTMKRINHDGEISRHPLSSTYTEKDLVVVNDKNLSFKNHIAQATAKEIAH